jgi:ADP-ribosylation factor-like protein 2
VGGQKTLRPYWRNYYEKTDGLIWVVDSADLARLEDCKKELHSLLQEERLCGATLLILANKQDIPNALALAELEQVRCMFALLMLLCVWVIGAGCARGGQQQLQQQRQLLLPFFWSCVSREHAAL